MAAKAAASFVKPFTGTIRDSDTAREAAIKAFSKSLGQYNAFC